MVRGVLRELAEEYPDIRYAVVLAYLPETTSREADFSDTMLPEGVETIHPKYAITWRNNWMLQKSDYVVTYITHSWGALPGLRKKQSGRGNPSAICLSDYSFSAPQ